MVQRYRYYSRNGRCYCYDNETRRGKRLRVGNPKEAERIVQEMNEALRQPYYSLEMAKAHINAANPELATRTWQDVMDEGAKSKTGDTKARWERAMKEKPFDTIRNRRLIETQAEHFTRLMESGTKCTKIFLRRLHNLSLGMNWLLKPVLPPKLWPTVEFKAKRAVTREDHEKIIAGEGNAEWRAFYEMLWHIGGAQTDTACLLGENFDRTEKLATFHRKKTGTLCQQYYGKGLAAVLEQLPVRGPLFPNIARMKESDRAIAFKRRCKLVGVSGVSLHCYRVSWAERALTAGVPERHAQAALGHKSKAVHHAYARKAQVKLAALEDYEEAQRGRNILQTEFSPPTNIGSGENREPVTVAA